jgi:hypothetical protein
MLLCFAAESATWCSSENYPRSRSVQTRISCEALEHISQFIVDTDCISCHNDSQAILSVRHLFPLESRVLERRHRTRLIRR